jgi:hypothetical protein
LSPIILPKATIVLSSPINASLLSTWHVSLRTGAESLLEAHRHRVSFRGVDKASSFPFESAQAMGGGQILRMRWIGIERRGKRPRKSPLKSH